MYDNLKSVVLTRFGREIRFNQKFEAFRGYYMFEAIVCNPASGHEKGRVESGVKYVRQNFLSGRYFKSFPDLKTQSIEWRKETANVRIHGTRHKKPIDLYEIEKDVLMALPEKNYDTDIIIPTRSTKDCRIKFNSNTYSVPYQYASKVLTLKATDGDIMIYNDKQLIAHHKRSYEKYLAIMFT